MALLRGRPVSRTIRPACASTASLLRLVILAERTKSPSIVVAARCPLSSALEKPGMMPRPEALMVQREALATALPDSLVCPSGWDCRG